MMPDWDPHLIAPLPGSDAETDIAFIHEHWACHPDHSDADIAESLWKCDRFDPDRRSCTAHGDRPPVCRNYPWYRDGPTAERAGNLPSRCSFLGDVPPDWRPAGAYPLIPIKVVRR
jgi:Fe-S-cluster containining protein